MYLLMELSRKLTQCNVFSRGSNSSPSVERVSIVRHTREKAPPSLCTFLPEKSHSGSNVISRGAQWTQMDKRHAKRKTDIGQSSNICSVPTTRKVMNDIRFERREISRLYAESVQEVNITGNTNLISQNVHSGKGTEYSNEKHKRFEKRSKLSFQDLPLNSSGEKCLRNCLGSDVKTGFVNRYPSIMVGKVSPRKFEIESSDCVKVIQEGGEANAQVSKGNKKLSNGDMKTRKSYKIFQDAEIQKVANQSIKRNQEFAQRNYIYLNNKRSTIPCNNSRLIGKQNKMNSVVLERAVTSDSSVKDSKFCEKQLGFLEERQEKKISGDIDNNLARGLPPIKNCFTGIISKNKSSSDLHTNVCYTYPAQTIMSKTPNLKRENQGNHALGDTPIRSPGGLRINFTGTAPSKKPERNIPHKKQLPEALSGKAAKGIFFSPEASLKKCTVSNYCNAIPSVRDIPYLEGCDSSETSVRKQSNLGCDTFIFDEPRLNQALDKYLKGSAKQNNYKGCTNTGQAFESRNGECNIKVLQQGFTPEQQILTSHSAAPWYPSVKKTVNRSNNSCTLNTLETGNEISLNRPGTSPMFHPYNRIKLQRDYVPLEAEIQEYLLEPHKASSKVPIISISPINPPITYREYSKNTFTQKQSLQNNINHTNVLVKHGKRPSNIQLITRMALPASPVNQLCMQRRNSGNLINEFTISVKKPLLINLEEICCTRIRVRSSLKKVVTKLNENPPALRLRLSATGNYLSTGVTFRSGIKANKIMGNERLSFRATPLKGSKIIINGIPSWRNLSIQKDDFRKNCSQYISPLNSNAQRISKNDTYEQADSRKRNTICEKVTNITNSRSDFSLPESSSNGHTGTYFTGDTILAARISELVRNAEFLINFITDKKILKFIGSILATLTSSCSKKLQNSSSRSPKASKYNFIALEVPACSSASGSETVDWSKASYFPDPQSLGDSWLVMEGGNSADILNMSREKASETIQSR